MISILQRLAIFSLPFTSLAGLNFLGELSNDLSIYIYIILIPYSLLNAKGVSKETKIPFILFCMLTTVIVISSFVNIEHLLYAEFRGRSALNKFCTSLMVLMFGFLITYASAFSIQNIKQDIFYPLYFGVLICVLYGALEVLSWNSTSIFYIYRPIASIIHTDNLFWGGQRFRSVAGEASFLALYIGFTLPWMLAAKRLITRNLRFKFAIYACILMVILSASRTGYIFVAGILVIDIITYYFISANSRLTLGIFRSISNYYMIGIFGAICIFSFYYDTIVLNVLAGESISNISRLASNTAAFRVFAEHPIFGGGFGQYAFHAVNAMPEWAWFSYEIVIWFTSPEATWPPSFTMFGRLGSELGLVGIVAWYGFWLWLLSKTITTAIIHKYHNGRTPIIGNAMMSGILYVLLSGIAYDSLGLPTIWIQLALCSMYITGKINEEEHAK